MRLVRWAAKRAKYLIETHGSHEVFMSIDPGNTGGAVVWVDGEAVASCVFDGFTGYHQLPKLIKKFGVRLFILETAYVGTSVGSALKLGFWRGFVVNECVHASFAPLTTIEVAPSTWQSKLPRIAVPRGQPWDKDAKDLATWNLYERSGVYDPNRRHDAIASAVGIGHWWLTVKKGTK